jgi:O-antigen/teichoic acid export membrane protein
MLAGALNASPMEFRSADSALRRLFRNAGYLLGGKAVGALLHLAALAIAGRALGPVGFGVLVLIHATAQTASGFASSQTWQALIQYGTGHLMSGRHRQLRDLLAFCAALDLCGGLFALLIAGAAVLLLAGTIGIPPELIGLAAAYCVLVPTMAATTPNGVLRLLDRFDILALQGTANPLLRLTGVSLAAACDGPLWSFALAWFVADLAGDLLIWVTAVRELRRRGLLAWRDVDPRRAWRDNSRLWSFVLATNASASVAALLGPASTLLVGGVLGPASAALYRISLTLVEAAAKPGDMVTRAFLPEIARLRSAGDLHRFWAVVSRVVLLSFALAAAMVAIFILFGERIVQTAFGHGYEGAGAIVGPASLALLGLLPAYFFDAAMVSLGQAGRGLMARCFGATGLFGLLAILMPPIGLAGAGWAYAAGALITGLAAAILLGRERLQDRARLAPSLLREAG